MKNDTTGLYHSYFNITQEQSNFLKTKIVSFLVDKELFLTELTKKIESAPKKVQDWVNVQLVMNNRWRLGMANDWPEAFKYLYNLQQPYVVLTDERDLNSVAVKWTQIKRVIQPFVSTLCVIYFHNDINISELMSIKMPNYINVGEQCEHFNIQTLFQRKEVKQKIQKIKDQFLVNRPKPVGKEFIFTYIDFEAMSTNPQIVEEIDIVTQFKYSLNWQQISKHSLTDDFVRKFGHMLSWNIVSQKLQISDEMIREHFGDINWKQPSKTRLKKLPSEILMEIQMKGLSTR